MNTPTLTPCPCCQENDLLPTHPTDPDIGPVCPFCFQRLNMAHLILQKAGIPRANT